MKEIKELQNGFAKPGRVVFISVRPKRREPVKVLAEVSAIEARGLEGDRYKNSGGRQVTFIQAEHLAAIASFLGKPEVQPQLTRRNIVVEGINLAALKGKQFSIGDAVFEYSGECHPCSRMEENLGEGGYNAMRGLGGITAKIVKSGSFKVGDAVTAL
ncbi:MOSC domain-containing protein [Chryseolinea lacunae]|uniref:MOSC domain-containing protein n=1 Tax=Chryseolinea lacunae TaxID=2801331 RepID=A0ABS1KQL6_9BACT|nr:MOSC domain-containing protein [Chryseolinea lacunae]MBL0741764.1 MOSC domain-containing protein [Chryseolinea lacunae]